MSNSNIQLIQRGGPGLDENNKEFMMKTSSDVADLPNSQTESNPATAGSKAYTQDMTKIYMLGIDDTWREV